MGEGDPTYLGKYRRKENLLNVISVTSIRGPSGSGIPNPTLCLQCLLLNLISKSVIHLHNFSPFAARHLLGLTVGKGYNLVC